MFVIRDTKVSTSSSNLATTLPKIVVASKDPVKGNLAFNTLDEKLYFADGEVWHKISDDTDLLAGDVVGPIEDNTVIKIQNQPVSDTQPSSNQVLTFTGSQWEPVTPTSSGGVTVTYQGDPIGPPGGIDTLAFYGQGVFVEQDGSTAIISVERPPVIIASVGINDNYTVNAGEKLVWNEILSNDFDIFDPDNNTMVIPEEGWYKFTVFVGDFSSNSNPSIELWLEGEPTSSRTRCRSRLDRSDPDNRLVLSFVTKEYCEPGQQFSVRAFAGPIQVIQLEMAYPGVYRFICQKL